jgi:hypothetical protein
MSLMNSLSERDRRALIVLAVGLVVSAVLYFGFSAGSGT